MLTGWTRLGAVGALALGGFLVADSFGASSGAQSAPPVTIPFAGVDTAPDLSDDGSIVVFSSIDLTGVSSASSSTIGSPRRPGRSRGPTVASTRRSAATGARWAGRWPRCRQPAGATPIPSRSRARARPPRRSSTRIPPTRIPPTRIPPPNQRLSRRPEPTLHSSSSTAVTPRRVLSNSCRDEPVADFGPPAISVDGAVVVVSVGTEVLRFDRTATGYAQTASFAPPSQNPPLKIVPAVDVSDDGSTVVFAAGPDLDAPSGLTVYPRRPCRRASTRCRSSRRLRTSRACRATVRSSRTPPSSPIRRRRRSRSARTRASPVALGPGTSTR